MHIKNSLKYRIPPTLKSTVSGTKIDANIIIKLPESPIYLLRHLEFSFRIQTNKLTNLIFADIFNNNGIRQSYKNINICLQITYKLLTQCSVPVSYSFIYLSVNNIMAIETLYFE